MFECAQYYCPKLIQNEAVTNDTQMEKEISGDMASDKQVKKVQGTLARPEIKSKLLQSKPEPTSSGKLAL